MFKRSISLTAGVAVAGAVWAGSLPAHAADIYDDSLKDTSPPIASAAYSWAGAYIGAHAGYAWSDVEVTDLDGFIEPGSWSFDADDWLAGGQIGYNWQRDRLVFGVEGDLGYFGLDGHRTDPADPESSLSASVDGGLYGTLTGRLGFASDRALLYAKGGAAFLNAELEIDDPDTIASSDETLLGWTVGGGLEYALASNWTAKAEYLYFDFEELRATDPVTGDSWDGDLDAHTVKIGINYKIGGDLYDSLY